MACLMGMALQQRQVQYLTSSWLIDTSCTRRNTVSYVVFPENNFKFLKRSLWWGGTACQSFCVSTSKSSTSSLVSSVPLRLPTAHTSLVWLARTRHTTPPLPPLSSVTRLRMNSPVCRSHSLTVPSSELVITNFLLNCRQVTALWCLLGPEQWKKVNHFGHALL